MKDHIEERFKALEGTFDIAEPMDDHFKRFEQRLNPVKHRKTSLIKRISSFAVAASIVLIFGIWIGNNFNSNKGLQLAEISNELNETQSYFTLAIQKELETIESLRSNDTDAIIEDGLFQLSILESQYKALTLELRKSAEDRRIIHAMISNFQQRIVVLQELVQQIENVKQLKSENDETYV